MPSSEAKGPTTDPSASSSAASGQSPALSGGEGSGVTPALLTPAAGAVFAISPGIPLERQRISIAAQAGGDVAKLTIYLDGQPLAALAGPPYRAFWPLAPGTHRAWAEIQDDRGSIKRSVEVEFIVTGQQ